MTEGWNNWIKDDSAESKRVQDDEGKYTLIKKLVMHKFFDMGELAAKIQNDEYELLLKLELWDHLSYEITCLIGDIYGSDNEEIMGILIMNLQERIEEMKTRGNHEHG